MIKLNLGGVEKFAGGPGSPALEGFLNVDIRDYPGVDIVADCRDLSGVYPIESVDVIRASHIIEHFTYDEAVYALTSWYRVLKPGGFLDIYCPNVRLMAKDLVNGKLDAISFSGYMFGRQRNAYDIHKFGYCQDALCDLVLRCQFRILSVDCRPNAYQYDVGVQAIKD